MMGLGKGPSKLSNTAQLWVSMFNFQGGILHFKISGCTFHCEDSPKKIVHACKHMIHMIFYRMKPCKNPTILKRGRRPATQSLSPQAWLPTRGRYLAPPESLPSPSLHLAPLKGFSIQGKPGFTSGKTPKKNEREQIVAGFDSHLSILIVLTIIKTN